MRVNDIIRLAHDIVSDDGYIVTAGSRGKIVWVDYTGKIFGAEFEEPLWTTVEVTIDDIEPPDMVGVL